MVGRKRYTVQGFGRRKKKYHGKKSRNMPTQDTGNTSTGPANQTTGAEHSGESSAAHDVSVAEKRFSLWKQFVRDDPVVDGEENFLLISFSFLDSLIKTLISASPCHDQSDCNFRICRRNGYASEIEVRCDRCSKVVYRNFTSSQKEFTDSKGVHHHHQINTRIVFAAQNNQMHLTKLLDFTNLAGIYGSLGKPSYRKIVEMITESCTTGIVSFLDQSRKIVKQELGASDEVKDISVTFDGTWQKRGHRSHYGAAFCIETTTSLIVDYCVLSNFCRLCEMMKNKLEKQDFLQWHATHQPFCHKNYEGSSNYMETRAAEIMWKRSIENGFRYTTLVSDGDSSVMKKLLELKPYGETKVEKEECINHIGKRLTNAMKTLKATEKAKGHSMGGNGKGKIPDNRIIKWSGYYKNAITEGAPDCELTSRRVMAILHHNASTVDKPRHDNCNPQWCWYLKAKEEGGADPIPLPERKVPLTERMVAAMTPVFVRLSSVDLLSRCMMLLTQNANESLHSTVWNRCSKAVFVGKPYLDCAVARSVITWNEGNSGIIRQASELGIPLSPRVHKMAEQKDKSRQKQAEKKPESNRNRKRKRMENSAQEHARRQSEGVSYAPGGF